MITSPHNMHIKTIRALLARRAEREEAGAFVTEGVRLCEEGLLTNLKPQIVLYTVLASARGQELARRFAEMGALVEEVPPALMEQITETEESQGILAVFPFMNLELPEDLNFVVVADALRDPGNLGTLLRTASAAGAQAVLLSPGTTDAFSPKVVRAAMGAHFRLPIHRMTWEAIEQTCRQRARPLQILVAEMENAKPCWHLDLRQPLALVVGGEAEGAGQKARQISDELISIPMPGRSESLNAAVAAAVLMFEIVRQRTS